MAAMEDSVLNKLNLYDLMGVIIPGFFGLIACYLAVDVLFSGGIGIDDKNWAIALPFYFFLILFFGVVSHELSQAIEWHLFRRIWKGLPNETFLDDKSWVITDNAKAKIKAIARNRFGIDASSPSPAVSRQVFSLIYASVRAGARDEKVETMLVQQGMACNSFVGVLAVTAVYAAIAIFAPGRGEIFGQPLSAFVIAALLATLALLMRRTRRFSEHHVAYVINSFYVNNLEKPVQSQIGHRVQPPVTVSPVPR